MCGIVALYGCNHASANQVAARMLEHIDHRGTDCSAIRVFGDCSVALGINRLSIVDLKGGNQPLADQRSLVHVVGNGFIYNYESIMSDAALAHYTFRTKNDFQVLPYLYNKYGADMVRHLEGMFAFCLYDTQNDVFVMGRDHLGKKPLYYAVEGGTLFVASECKALMAACGNSINVEELPPGHVGTLRGLASSREEKEEEEDAAAALLVSRYYQIPRCMRTPCTQLVRQLLASAVRKRMRADVEVGTFLSGGVDSSIVTALANKVRPGLKAITVGVEGSPDLESARRVARHLGVEHIVCSFTTDELMALVPKMVWHLESYNPSAINCAVVNYLAAKKAKEHGVDVVLCGEGADEVFGGYMVLRHMECEEFVRSCWEMIENIHATECKRLDRSTMAATLEARCPFLDRSVVEYAMNLPYACKIKQMSERRVEKHILREAFSDALPSDVVWREKEPFDQGSGGRGIIGRINALVSTNELDRMQRLYPHAKIQSKEMAYLYKIFRERFGDLGGDRQFSLFGNYPVMQHNITVRTETSGS